MDNDHLSRQIDLYLQWRQHIMRLVTRYRAWINDCGLTSEDSEERLNDALDILRRDEIKLAFVGEFSRGKTELINALFFADLGVRLLPSGGGRTTMCPTELRFDSKDNTSYIRLLPIETRLSGSSIASFKKIPDHWVYVPLNQNDPEQLKKAFREVASNKAVTRDNAAAMGFQTDNLETCEHDPERVMVPAWRHALINFDHPLLRHGLTIIDTPGLNALGCEPELTFSLLPEAHAILFLLSATAGVSSTDLDIWNRHIRDLALQETTGVYAILNKIDSLWDPLETDAQNDDSIDQMRFQCARQLSIAPDEIIPVSAKQGLMAKVDRDDIALEHSNLPALEQLISNDLANRKALVVQNRVINSIIGMLHGSRKMLKRRRELLKEQISLFEKNAQNAEQQLIDLHNHTKAEQTFYHKKLIMMKSSRKVIEREGSAMLALVSAAKLDQYRREANEALSASWTIVGMNTAIDNFFNHLREDMQALIEHQSEIQEQVARLYAQYEAEQGLAPMDYARFTGKPYLTRLDDLRNKSGSFRRNLKKLLTEQKSTSQRFLLTIVTQAAGIYQQCRKEARQWLDDVLLPIFQNVQDQKQFLDEQVVRLRALAQAGEDAKSKAEKLNQMLATIEQQLAEAGDILTALRQPSPFAPPVRHRPAPKPLLTPF